MGGESGVGRTGDGRREDVRDVGVEMDDCNVVIERVGVVRWVRDDAGDGVVAVAGAVCAAADCDVGCGEPLHAFGCREDGRGSDEHTVADEWGALCA